MKRILMPWVLGIVLTVIMLYPLLKGQVPFPGGLLLGRFFPWNTQSWEGYPLGVPYKEFIAADTVRQTYPWRELAISELKQGRIPWWNSYQASGTPLIANWQTAAFYPLNILYWFLPFQVAWVVQVLLQPVLMIVGVVLWLKRFSLPLISRALAAVGAAFASYQVVWLELNTVGHAALWLPWGLWLIDRNLRNGRGIPWGLTIVTVCTLLSGHLQTSLMVLCVWGWYLAWHLVRKPWRTWVRCSLPILLGVLILSPLLAITWELTTLSPRLGQDAQIVKQFMVPWERILTLISPNLFGNPATETLWVREYGEFQMYFGLVPLVLALLGMRSTKTQFLSIIFLGSLALAMANPLAWLPYLLKIPVFESSAPSRWLFVTQWAGALLAGFGLTSLLKGHYKRWVVASWIGGVGMVLVLLSLSQLGSDPVWQARFWSSFKNSLIPFASLTLVAFALLIGKKNLVLISVLAATMFELQFFALRYLPMSPMTHIFPSSPPFEALATLPPYRAWGDYTASMTSNTWIPQRVLGVEGYDSLQIEDYARLLAFGQTPQLTEIPRSDANLGANQHTFKRQRLLDILSVAYLLEKSDQPKKFESSEVYGNEVPLVWSDEHFAIFQNQTAQPLWWTVPFHEVIASDSGRLERIFDPDWDPNRTVILDDHPSYSVPKSLVTPLYDQQPLPVPARMTFSILSPTRILFEVTSEVPVWLVGSTNWYPGWRAQIDGAPAVVQKVNFSFQGVLVPSGTHQVELRYFPQTLPDFSSTW